MVMDIYDALVGLRVGEGVRVSREFKWINDDAKIMGASLAIITLMESRQRHLVDNLRSKEEENTSNWI